MTVDGVDVSSLTAYLEKEVGLNGPVSAALISGGRSNLTYAITDGARRWVLRRPPLGHVLASAHDMGREYRVMAGLARSDVPVPTMVTHCTDSAVIGAEFYVMEFVDGTIYRMPEQLFSVRDAKALANSLVDTLTTLHRVTPEAFGLGSLGRPDGYAERQVRTWIRQLDASKSRELPELARLAERLAADVPVNPKHAIVHGDYRLDNVVVGTDADLAAVLDWEMSTLGDPLTDLASLAVWWDGLAGLDSPVAAVPGEYLDVDSTYLMNRYAENIGAEPARMNWYLAFAYFKVAAIFEGIYFRFSQGQTVGAGFDRIGALVAPMTEAGHRELDS